MLSPEWLKSRLHPKVFLKRIEAFSSSSMPDPFDLGCIILTRLPESDANIVYSFRNRGHYCFPCYPMTPGKLGQWLESIGLERQGDVEGNCVIGHTKHNINYIDFSGSCIIPALAHLRVVRIGCQKSITNQEVLQIASEEFPVLRSLPDPWVDSALKIIYDGEAFDDDDS